MHLCHSIVCFCQDLGRGRDPPDRRSSVPVDRLVRKKVEKVLCEGQNSRVSSCQKALYNLEQWSSPYRSTIGSHCESVHTHNHAVKALFRVVAGTLLFLMYSPQNSGNFSSTNGPRSISPQITINALPGRRTLLKPTRDAFVDRRRNYMQHRISLQRILRLVDTPDQHSLETFVRIVPKWWNLPLSQMVWKFSSGYSVHSPPGGALALPQREGRQDLPVPAPFENTSQPSYQRLALEAQLTSSGVNLMSAGGLLCPTLMMFVTPSQ